MADEATLHTEIALPLSFTCANATGIEKGAVLALSDPKTAAANAAVGSPVAGICASEKIASNGTTSVDVYRQGWFKMTASGSISAGDPVCTSNAAAPNRVEKAATNEEDLLGTALETATNGETLLIELNPRGISLA